MYYRIVPLSQTTFTQPSKSKGTKMARWINKVEQRTIFRQGNHISPHFPIIILNVLKQIFVVSLNLLGKNVKERNLFLRKIKKIQEIRNKWLNMVTRRNMVFCSINTLQHLQYKNKILYNFSSQNVIIGVFNSPVISSSRWWKFGMSMLPLIFIAWWQQTLSWIP